MFAFIADKYSPKAVESFIRINSNECRNNTHYRTCKQFVVDYKNRLPHSIKFLSDYLDHGIEEDRDYINCNLIKELAFHCDKYRLENK